MKTVNEWIALTHDVAVDHGWWEPFDLSLRSVKAKLMLVVSEISEAVEIAREPNFVANAAWVMHGKERVPYAEHLRLVKADGRPLLKPEGFGVEAADALIRIFDLCGAMGLREEDAGDEIEDFAGLPIESLPNADAILASLMDATAAVGAASDLASTVPAIATDRHEPNRSTFAAALFGAVHILTQACGVLGIELEELVEGKHAYNKTRPYRHGNKKA